MSGRSGNNRRNRYRFSGRREESQKSAKRSNEISLPEMVPEKGREVLHERPRWVAPVLPANPTTTPDCPWCGNKIKDITTAISDKGSGNPIHFDCVLTRIVEMEQLENNDTVCYIGGGRFGIIHYNNPPDMRDISIKKIIEWEIKDRVYEWRKPFSEYFSLT
jgi:hypothetical protein